MNVSPRVREIYDRRPYPASVGAFSAVKWWRSAPPIEWINSVWQPDQPSPQRILIAGCGSGLEAFAFRGRFPTADIVAVDFSPRSIAAARNAQNGSSGTRPIRFLVGDLGSRNLSSIVGDGFDFVSCHGVLSYIPQPGRALRNLARCLKPNGALYLGVNGSQHLSVGAREFLPAFGFDVFEMGDDRKLRETLKLRDAILGSHGVPLAKQAAGYLASDVFGPLIHNLFLAEWILMCRRAGLHFLASHATFRSLRPVLNSGLQRLFLPRSRAEVCALVEALAPSGFHRLVFSRRPAPSPPWDNADALLGWRPVMTSLFAHRWPKRNGSWTAVRTVKLKSPPTNTLMELGAPEWELEILRRSDGKVSFREILSRISVPIAPESVRQRAYQAYQAMLINLRPPVPRRVMGIAKRTN